MRFNIEFTPGTFVNAIARAAAHQRLTMSLARSSKINATRQIRSPKPTW
jgi:hypothetical protein